jgi:hypothetical protein
LCAAVHARGARASRARVIERARVDARSRVARRGVRRRRPKRRSKRKNQIKRKNVIFFAIDSIVRALFDLSARPSTRGRRVARARRDVTLARPRFAIARIDASRFAATLEQIRN